MKYFILKIESGEEIAVIFPRQVVHASMAEAVQTIRIGGQNWRRSWRSAEIVGAGFIGPDLVCYGKSDTLKVVSRGEVDTALVRREFASMLS